MKVLELIRLSAGIGRYADYAMKLVVCSEDLQMLLKNAGIVNMAWVLGEYKLVTQLIPSRHGFRDFFMNIGLALVESC